MNSRPLAVVGLIVALALMTGCESIRVRYLMNEANKQYVAQNYEQAIKIYEQILRIRPTDWTTNYQVAVSYLALYHPGSTHEKDVMYANNGIQQLEKLLGPTLKAPDAATLDKVRGFYIGILQAANMTDKAIAYYEKLVKQEPTNATYHVQLAGLYDKKGDFPGEIREYEKRAELEPQNKEAWYTIGVVYWARSYRGGASVSMEEREQLVKKGLDAIDRALKLDPEYFEAMSYKNLLYREQAKVLQAKGDLEGANKMVQQATDIVKKAMEIRKKQSAAK